MFSSKLHHYVKKRKQKNVQSKVITCQIQCEHQASNHLLTDYCHFTSRCLW